MNDLCKKYNIVCGEKEKKLIHQYLSRVAEFTKNHGIDMELYNDIEEMFIEKLGEQQELNSQKIIKMIQEVGEPEIIFADYSENKKQKQKAKKTPIFYETLIQENWQRDNTHALLLGVSGTLSEKIGIPLLGIRILFVCLFFFAGMSFWIYVLMGIILPVKGVSYAGKNFWKYLRTQIRLVFRDGFYNSFRTLKKASGKIFSLFLSFFQHLGSIFRFLTFGIIAFILSILMFLLLIAGGMYISQFSLGYVDFYSMFPKYWLGSIFGGIIACFLLSIASFLYALNKKNLPNYLLAIAGFCLITSLLFGISSGFELIKKYSVSNSFSQKIEAPVESGEYMLDFSSLEKESILDHFSHISSVKINAITGSTLHITEIYTFRGDEKMKSQFLSALNEPLVSKSGNTLFFQRNSGNLFKEKIPFTFLQKEILIDVPKSVSLRIFPEYKYYYENVFLSEKYRLYENFLNSQCNASSIYYASEENAFVCDPQSEDLKQARNQYIENTAIENFEKYSSLQHKDEYKRDYYGDFEGSSDWNFQDFSFEENNILKMQFSDMSLEIEAQVKYQEDGENINFSEFHIESVSVNENFRTKYYKNIESILPYISSDTPEEDNEE